MTGFTAHVGIAAPLDQANVDTDQIIPKQFSPDAICDLVELLLDTRSNSLSGQVLHVGGV